MKISKIEQYIAQLLRIEGGIAPASTHYADLRDAFVQGGDSGFRAEAPTANGLEPTLFGLSLTDARRLWRDYYGIKGVEKMGADCLRRMSYEDWQMAVQRAWWLPLNCDKMPYQNLSNMVADSVRFYGDASVVLHQLLDFLEQNRRFFGRNYEPLPETDVINQLITRRLYCQIRSTEVCNYLIRQLADLRIDYIHQRAETDAAWARNANELIRRSLESRPLAEG